MKFATLPNGIEGGALIVVSRDLTRAAPASDIAPSLLAALRDWTRAEPLLQTRATEVEAGTALGLAPFDATEALAPLPRAPLIQKDEARGIDCEGQFGVIVTGVPMGATPEQALAAIRLIVQINDWSTRVPGPWEMKRVFGFLQAKPSTGFAPCAVTPDELGAKWQGVRVCLPLTVEINGERLGAPNGAEMDFHFGQIMAHATRTRRLTAGTIIGSGTVSNADRAAGSAFLAERRVIEKIDTGDIQTPFLRFGDRVTMQARLPDGRLFGQIDARVVAG